MASPVKLYQKEMHDNLGFFATWLPGDPIEIGDAGVLKNGGFRREGSLAELGIRCDVSEGSSTQDVKYTSTSGTKLAFSAGANAAGVAKTEITIDFSREGAFVFHASGLRTRRLSNRMEVARKLLAAYRTAKWPKNWWLVEALHTAQRATIIVSEGNSAGVSLAASAAAIPSVSLADPKITLSVTSTRGRLVHVVGAQGLRPLYACLRVEDPLFGEPRVEAVRGIGEPDDEPTLSRPIIEDLLDS
ncbi:MAG TPA: hypothetical protein VJ801_13010 [Polyangia bacterium]|jgi:hypothetical protein|nr:hypothetical protein [Polyangia bacterium]